MVSPPGLVLTCGAGVDHACFGEFVLQLEDCQAGLGGLGRADRTHVFGFVTLVIDNLTGIGLKKKEYIVLDNYSVTDTLK